MPRILPIPRGKARPASSDYHRIERAILYLDAHARGQPSLDDVARHLGLSLFHCQRLFHRWAGVTPKHFLQIATLGYAKALLRDSRPVLEAALESGLSGPGRLHDLFLSIEAMTPGEYRRGGEGLTIRWGIHPTPVGDALIALTDRGICAIRFPDSFQHLAFSIQPLHSSWPRARLERDQPATAPIARELSARILGRPRERLSVILRGAPFQVKVWEALLAIPAGAVTTYGEVAARIGRPQAHRATASAIGANEIACLIPCHRVLRATGAIGGYRWGEARKRALLAIETCRERQALYRPRCLNQKRHRRRKKRGIR
jgi:AraC family transcriptional regulator of adaptative response/methylated-DNA-[protein]-cysteine methyltransferase